MHVLVKKSKVKVYVAGFHQKLKLITFNLNLWGIFLSLKKYYSKQKDLPKSYSVCEFVSWLQ